MTRVLFITMALFLAFIGAALFITADAMTEALSAAVFIAAGLGIYRWGSAAWRVYFRGALTTESWGILGIVLFLFAEASSRVYTVAYINLDRPEYLQLLHISPFIVYAKLIALGLFIAATKFEGEKPTKLGTFAAAAVAFFGLMLTTIGPLVGAKVAAFIAGLCKALWVFPH